MSATQQTEESTAIATREDRSPIAVGSQGIEIGSLESLYRFSVLVAKSPFAPKDFRSPESIAVAIQYGLELGLSPMQSLQSIAVINGKPSIYGDAMLGVVRCSGLLEWITEEIEGEGENKRAVCEVKRAGQPKARRSVFSIADAKRASLWGKQGPWAQYPERMLMFRARGFALRDEFGDVLKGLISAEEAHDYPARGGSVQPIRQSEPASRTDGLLDRIRENAPEVAAHVEAFIPPSSVVDPEPEAIDAESMDLFGTAIDRDDAHDPPVEQYIGEEGAEALAAKLLDAFGKGYSKAVEKICAKYGKDELQWLSPSEAAQVVADTDAHLAKKSNKG